MHNKIIIILVILVIILVIILLIINIIRWLHYKILFRPMITMADYPNIPFKNIYLDITDGNELNENELENKEYINIWYFDNYHNTMTVIYCHGNYGNISHRSYIIEFCYTFKLNLLLFDYRGYGKSKGKMSIEGINRDSYIAYKYLTKYTSPDNIIIWGESLGGYVTINLASNFPCKYVILTSTFSSLEDIIYYKNNNNIINKTLKGFIPLLIDSMMSKEYIKNISSPIIIMHSFTDNIIPYECAKILYSNIKHKKKKFITIGGTHSNPIISKDEIEILLDFCEINRPNNYEKFIEEWSSKIENFVKTIKE